MKSKWIEYNGKKILYQDFSNFFFNTNAVKEELEQVESIVLTEPKDSILVSSQQVGAVQDCVNLKLSAASVIKSAKGGMALAPVIRSCK